MGFISELFRTMMQLHEQNHKLRKQLEIEKATSKMGKGVKPYPKVPYRCPVCGGIGDVAGGYYTPGSAGNTSALRETCRACYGTGFIVV